MGYPHYGPCINDEHIPDDIALECAVCEEADLPGLMAADVRLRARADELTDTDDRSK